MIDNNGLVAYSTIVSNWLPLNRSGAGLYIHNVRTGTAKMEVRNCLITSNQAPGTTSLGGGLYLGTGIITVASCTIVDNAAGRGGGIAVSSAMLLANIGIYNTIVASNRKLGTGPADLYLPANHLTNAFYYSCSDCLTNAVQGNITNEPVFLDAASRNYRLARGSPGINAGTNESWMTNGVDLDSHMRIRYYTADMGAYEHIYEAMIFRSW